MSSEAAVHCNCTHFCRGGSYVSRREWQAHAPYRHRPSAYLQQAVAGLAATQQAQPAVSIRPQDSYEGDRSEEDRSKRRRTTGSFVDGGCGAGTETQVPEEQVQPYRSNSNLNIIPIRENPLSMQSPSYESPLQLGDTNSSNEITGPASSSDTEAHPTASAPASASLARHPCNHDSHTPETSHCEPEQTTSPSHCEPEQTTSAANGQTSLHIEDDDDALPSEDLGIPPVICLEELKLAQGFIDALKRYWTSKQIPISPSLFACSLRARTHQRVFTPPCALRF